MIRKIFLLLITALILFCACGGTAEENSRQAQVTVMLYMAGNNLETDSQWASKDIIEMLKADYDAERVNVCIALGGARKWYILPDLSTNSVTEARIEPDGSFHTFGVQQEACMGDAATLSRFINDCVENYPAERYALMMWDHGGGPLLELCNDETKSGNGLLMSEFRDALAATPFGEENKLEWIGMNACLMGSAEIASICAPYAKYFLASEDILIAPDFDYGTVLKGIEKDASGAETCIRAADSYIDSFNSYWRRREPETLKRRLTISVIDLAKMDDVEAALNHLFSVIAEPVDIESFISIARGRVSAEEFGLASGSHYDLVDLFSLAEQCKEIAPAEAEALLAAIEEAVIYQRAQNVENAHGLTIYYPHYESAYYMIPALFPDNEKIMALRELDFAEKYCDFIDKYYLALMGEPIADMSDLMAGIKVSKSDEDTVISLQIAEEDLRTVDDVRLLTVASSASFGDSSLPGGYYIVDTTDRLHFSEGENAIKYVPRALKYQQDGKVSASNLSYVIKDGYYFVNAVLMPDDFKKITQAVSDEKEMAVPYEPDYDSWEYVWLIGKMNPERNGLDIIGVTMRSVGEAVPVDNWERSAYSGLYLSDELWHTVCLVSYASQPVYAEDESLAPADLWPTYDNNGNGFEWKLGYVDNTSPWELIFTEYGGNIFGDYMQLVVRDLQGREHTSSLIPIPGMAVKDTCRVEYLLYEGEHGSAVLQAVHAVNDGTWKGLLFEIEEINIEDEDEKTIGYLISNVRVNGSPLLPEKTVADGEEVLKEYYYAGGGLEGVDYLNKHMSIPLELLPDSALSKISDIEFDFSLWVWDKGEWTFIVGEDVQHGVSVKLKLDLDLTAIQ